MTHDWGTPDVPAVRRPGVLSRQERTPGFWWRAIRRRPLIAVLSAVGFLAPVGLFAVVPETGFWHYAALAGWVLVVKQTLSTAGERLTRGIEAADEAAETDGARRPVDVRTGEPVTPSLDRGTPARAAVKATTGVAAALAVGCVGAGAWAAVDGGPAVAAFLGALGALIALGAVQVGRVARRRLAYVVSRPGPVLVRVAGHRPAERRWVLEPLDGEGEVGEVTLSGGGEHLVAGDVLHAWGDVLVDEAVRPRKRRLVLTGPFGTLLAVAVLDGRNLEVRASRDEDARRAGKASGEDGGAAAAG